MDVSSNPWDYNVFAFGDVNVKWSDSEGKVAGQGNVYIESYNVGSKSESSLYSVVGGGDVVFKYGTVHNGGLYSGGKADIYSATIHGTVAARGDLNVYWGGTYDGNFIVGGNDNIPEYLEGKLVHADPGSVPVDFAAAKSEMIALSSYYSSQSNASVDKNGYEYTLVGTNDVNYFTLTAEELSTVSSLTIDIAEGAKAIINVSGTSASVGNFQFFDSYGNEFLDAQSVLFNFYDATDIVFGNVGIKGSVLAVNAHVDFNQSGQKGVYIDGNMIATSVSGSGEFHSKLFTPPPQNVPEPASLAFLATGTLILGLFARKKRS